MSGYLVCKPFNTRFFRLKVLYPCWGLTKAGVSRLVMARGLKDFLARLYEVGGVTSIRQYKVVQYSPINRQKDIVNVSFIKQYTPPGLDDSFQSSHFIGQDIPQPNGTPIAITDQPMQEAIWGKKIVLVPAKDPRNKYHKTVAIVPIIPPDSDRAEAVIIYQFEQNRPLRLRDLKLINRQFQRHVISEGSERVNSYIRHETTQPLNTANIKIGVAREKLQRLDIKETSNALDLATQMLMTYAQQYENLRALIAFIERGLFTSEEKKTRPAFLRKKPINLREVINGAVFVFGKPLPKITVEDGALSKEIPFLADPEKLTQIYCNLFGNALKYTFSDRPLEITITADYLKDKDGQPYAIKQLITDNGRGIFPEDHERVFLENVRGKEQTPESTTHGTGSGLGLFICRIFMVMHAGSIRLAESTVGVGSTFELIFPLIKKPTPPPPTA
ncbi:MAG: HAMP domain-containing sensor histidine kinase [Candidatus Margulisbacteria bacterium]|nr:HAMP domain-containing sensor histidine kinase [Candidatus Margulisiibacteriota bacterium]